MRPGDWAARVDKPRELLYEHAIEGFFGPEDTLMPARGGNDELSDEDVMRAVDYMVELAKHYLVQQRGNVK
jgi:cytochrome c5